MDWSSKNVPKGGIFHPPKVQYSPETREMMKILIDESKLSMMQRKKMNYHLRNGEPFFPLNTRSESLTSHKKPPPILIRPGSSKRRTQDTILQSGVYEREKFVPELSVNRELEKIKLQDKMAFGKYLTRTKPKKVVKSMKNEVEPNRFDQLVLEIKEREQFLEEMDKLGNGNQYRDIIRHQIQEKIREMNELKSKA